jgi:uncharacterized protein (DUF885 family)
MCRRTISCLLAAAVALTIGSGRSDSRQAPPPTAAGSLQGLAEEYYGWLLQDDYYTRLKAGLPVERLPDLSLAKSQADAARAQALAARVAAVTETGLAHDDWLTRQLLLHQLGLTAKAPRFYWLEPVITPYRCPLPMVQLVFTTYRFHGRADLEHYLALLRQYPGLVRTLLDIVRTQRQKGIVLPRDEIALVVPFLSSMVTAPEQSPFFVADSRLVGVDRDDGRTFQGEVAAEIRSGIAPAIEELVAFVKTDYASSAPVSVGVWQYPGGREYYRELVRVHTGTDLTPSRIHEIGLSEVARLRHELDLARQACGFAGTLPAFMHLLRTDPRFFPASPDEVGQRLLSVVERVRPKVGQFFRHTPRAPYGVRRLPASLEGGQTFGYYQQPTSAEPTGYYLFNGSDLAHRSLLNAAALILHELVPGHHFQICLAAENSALPAFRREAAYTGYVEGWGDYASELGRDMGIYADPWALCGRLAMDLFVSARLVVDTGMNDLGWSREKAIDYMRENTLETDAQIGTETLRYACDMPGQALAYKIGSRRLLELRAAAKRRLGTRFDIRAFHDWVLGSGAMPLSLLDAHVDWEILEALSGK